MEIKSLTNTDFETIFKAFSQAFADYEVQINEKQFNTMLRRRGFNPDLSFAAFENGDIVSFTLNGIGNFNKILTAYDTGTGTLKEYRGKGLATEIFEYSIPFLKEAGVRQYLLEVLQHNENAVSVYRKLGFETTREFNYFICKNEEVKNEIKNIEFDYFTREIFSLYNKTTENAWDYYPSWQNSIASVLRWNAHIFCMGLFIDNEVAGYFIFDTLLGDIMQLAVVKQHRRKGVGSLLLQEMLKRNKNDVIKILNADTTCTSLVEFLKAKNIGISGKQFEMIKNIE